jgi:hypothetical protein
MSELLQPSLFANDADALILFVEASRASQLALPVNDWELPTIDGSGLSSCESSWRSSLAGYLLRTCQVFYRSQNPNGSSLIWNRRVTKSNRMLPVLGRSAPRTSGTGSGSSGDGWTTPTVRDAESLAKVTRGAGSLAAGQERVPPLAVQASWPTPRSEDSEQTGAHGTAADTLTSKARLDWNTPCEADGRKGAGPNQHTATLGRQMKRCAGPPAPEKPSTSGKPAAWCTPKVPNGGRQPAAMGPTGQTEQGKRQVSLHNQLDAPAGAVNPAWVAQLQGLPADWCHLPDATLSKLLATRTRGSSRI